MTKKLQEKYFVYMVKCADQTLYTGLTNDIEKRVVAHNTGTTGAKYTRGRRPVMVVYIEQCETKSDALKRECVVKKLTRKEKIFLCHSRESGNPERTDNVEIYPRFPSARE